MKRFLVLLYGVAVYGLFFGTFLYMIGFVENLVVPKGIDGEPLVPLGQALLTNAALLLLFAVQHSVMARPAFKRWWTRIIPEPVERSTYVLCASLCLIVMVYYWQPLGGVMWSVESDVLGGLLIGLSLTGWLIVLLSTFMINHFDLFGLRQVWLYFRGEDYTHVTFRMPLFYRYVRHPLYLGFLIAFWAAPTMTVTHFLFAALTTAYILTAIQLEERDLLVAHGDSYRKYKKWAPMLIPFTKGKRPENMTDPQADSRERESPASAV
jgi:protein-S-isoprenylcysteine O-methyltransferase Ste14